MPTRRTDVSHSKRYMIRCDIEGVTGVTSYEQAEPGKPDYAYGRAMFLSDLHACLRGLRAGGAEEIVIYDEHYYGRNIRMDEIGPDTRVICGKPPYRADWPGGLDRTFAGVILLGFHAKAGTKGGLLPHSYELDIRDLRLNGISVGEIGMEAAVAGDCDVPVQLVVADSAGATEARGLLPAVSTVVTKESLGDTGATCLSAESTAKTIEMVAQEIATTPPPVQPYRTGAYVWLEVVLNDGPYLNALRPLAGSRLRGERTVVFGGPNATAVWSAYWQLKLKVQASMGSAQ
jgi:D-amino peptidase